ncbi:MAG TPA: phosphoribosyltransferase [Myxococcaceae bacterium]|nr:phosphoribosyltransferase [Myxococcaceae bacterium]
MSPRSSRRRPESPQPPPSPQGELPRGLLGQDRSGPRTIVREMSWAQFDGAVQAMARAISAAYTCDLVVGIAPGGLYVGSALASALGKPFHPVRILGRTRDPLTGRMPKVMAMPREVKGARILLVDDVIASGMTLRRAVELARKAGARQIRTATLLCRDQGAAPDWTVLVMEGPLVFPWDYHPVTEDGRFDLAPEPEPEPGSRRPRSRA